LDHIAINACVQLKEAFSYKRVSEVSLDHSIISLNQDLSVPYRAGSTSWTASSGASPLQMIETTQIVVGYIPFTPWNGAQGVLMSMDLVGNSASVSSARRHMYCLAFFTKDMDNIFKSLLLVNYMECVLDDAIRLAVLIANNQDIEHCAE
jgi:hypothetical protein